MVDPTITPPSPERIAALQFIEQISHRMFDVGGTWVNEKHAMAVSENNMGTGISEILSKLGTKPGAPVTPQYELADRLSAVLNIKVVYLHNEGYVIEGKDSLDKLANAGIKAIANRGYGEKQRPIV